jgi:hypothetical protein
MHPAGPTPVLHERLVAIEGQRWFSDRVVIVS